MMYRIPVIFLRTTREIVLEYDLRFEIICMLIQSEYYSKASRNKFEKLYRKLQVLSDLKIPKGNLTLICPEKGFL